MTKKLALEADLLLINVLSAMLISTIILIPDSMVRAILGLPFILLFPGYTLSCALFPNKGGLDGPERVSLSICLSLAIVPMMGLVLNYTPWGVGLLPTLLSLSFFTLSMSLAAWNRRNSLPIWGRFFPSVDVPDWARLSSSDKIKSAGLIACAIAAVGLTIHFASAPRLVEGFTQFYVLGAGGELGSYPMSLSLGENGAVILGIGNQEYMEVTYLVDIRLDGEDLRTIEGIRLKHEERWEQTVHFTPHKMGDKMKLEFLLYREGIGDPYRSLQLWISVKPPK